MLTSSSTVCAEHDMHILKYIISKWNIKLIKCCLKTLWILIPMKALHILRFQLYTLKKVKQSCFSFNVFVFIPMNKKNYFAQVN